MSNTLSFVVLVYRSELDDDDEDRIFSAVSHLGAEHIYIASPSPIDNYEDNPEVCAVVALGVNDGLEIVQRLDNISKSACLVLKPGETIQKEVLDRALLKLSQAPPETVISFLHQDLNYPDPYHHRLFRLGQGHRFKINESDPSSWQHVYHNKKGKLQQIYLPQAEIEVIPCSEG